MIHFGDIKDMTGKNTPAVDVVIGGSPCQDLSVAGKRAGLSGERSGLFMEQIRIIKELREHDRAMGRSDELLRPRFMVWENVPGSLSSPGKGHSGEDFQAVIHEICKIVRKEAPPVPVPKGGWPHAGCISGVGDSGTPFSIAWRLHDSQWWGVPQRRKRISLLADFNGESAAEVLFEPKLWGEAESGCPDPLIRDIGRINCGQIPPVREGVSGDSEQSAEEGKGVTAGTERSPFAAMR